MSLTELSKLLGAQLRGSNVFFNSISTDTRELQKGNLYVAFKGSNFDGHDFIETATQKGAAAVIVERQVETKLPIILVKNTRIAYGQIAKQHRQKFDIPIIAITGSCGKTTTKVMTKAILKQCGCVLATEANLNNDIGVPKTLLNLNSSHQYAVIEMGMNHTGEIKYVTEIACPTVAVITNAAPVHLEGVHNVEGVARAKGEIFNGLSKDGVAILNADDQYFNFWRKLANNHVCISFGIQEAADVIAQDLVVQNDGSYQFVLRAGKEKVSIHLPLLGEHNVVNALAASAAAYAVKVPLKTIKTALENMQPVPKRMIQHAGLAGSTIIDDSYNANPYSVRAALQVLMRYPGERVFVFGDMGELGETAQSFHRDIGIEAKKLGVDRCYAIGKLTPIMIEAFGEGGYHFDNRDALVQAVSTSLNANTTVLVKGSKVNRMWEFVDAFVRDTAETQ